MQSSDYPPASLQYNYHRNARLPRLPNITFSYQMEGLSKSRPEVITSPTSPTAEEDSYYASHKAPKLHQQRGLLSHMKQNEFSDMDSVPLQPYHLREHDPSSHIDTPGDGVNSNRTRHRSGRKRKERFLSWNTPWIVYILTIIQVAIFVAELIKNTKLTHSPIEIHPQFNPMIGPSPYVLINMGALYVPCMKNVAGVQNSNLTIEWPCPDSVTISGTCSLSDLCGFAGVPNPHVGGLLSDKPAPNQWFRFITPIFLHAGIVHISFNMLLQVVLGREMERTIGHVRFFVVYFSSGIFGFIMGGNFAPPGIAATGASGSLFGIISLTLLDLLYTWRSQKSPIKELLSLLLVIVITFVLGLLPGVDNFSHIGGFLMGLVLGISILRSPQPMREHTRQGISQAAGPYSNIDTEGDTEMLDPQTGLHRKTASANPFSYVLRVHEGGRKRPIWYAWLFLRIGTLVTVLVCFILLLNNFYKYNHQCSWCKYLSCLPVKNWCSIGDLTFTSTGN